MKRKQIKPAESFAPKADYRTYEQQAVDTPSGEAPAVIAAIDATLGLCQAERKRAFMPHAREGGPRQKFCVHPSQTAGCPRKVQFVVMNAEEDARPPDPRTERIFDIGHESHRRIQGYLFEAWRRGAGGVTRVWEDVKLSIAYLMVSGELDAIVEFHNAVRYVVEIKTAGKAVMERLSGPKTEWVWQAHLYMYAVGLRDAVILVECRDDARMMEFYVPFSESVWSAIEDQILDVLVAIEEERLTEAAPAKGECMWCRYKTVCKSPRLQKRMDYGKVLKYVSSAS